MSLVERELLTLPEHLSSPPVFSGVRVTRSLVLYVYFVDLCLSFCTFSFGHCVVCSSSIYGFWLPLWYLQTLLTKLSRVYLLFSLFINFYLCYILKHLLMRLRYVEKKSYGISFAKVYFRSCFIYKWQNFAFHMQNI